MLRINVEIEPEGYDERTGEFIDPIYMPLDLEHSLVSVSKWESKWHKSFISSDNKTTEEVADYIKCMTINPNIDPNIYNYLSTENIDQINKYIEAPMTATYFYEDENIKGGRKETITSELVYYWMISLNIPFECQDWHLNKLLTLIRVCNVKNSPPKTMGKGDIARRNAALNAARRQKMNTKG